MLGASNPHPHGQIWASEFVPNEAVVEVEHQRRHRETHGSQLLVEYAEQEVGRGDRLVTANDHWVVVVPYWAYWPTRPSCFLAAPWPRSPGCRRRVRCARRHPAGDVACLRPTVRDAVSLLLRVDTAPGGPEGSWQLHAHYYPPLLRSAEVAKIPASYELLANLQRDITPEAAAAALRAVR